MKKHILSVVLFVLAFAVAYVCLCYCVPDWRLKLAAAPHIYFIESLKKLAWIKAMISFAVSAGICTIFLFIQKRREIKNPSGIAAGK